MSKPGLAIVTGASGGIGSVFTRALAKRGHRMLVVARKREALEKLADDIDGEVTVAPADLGTQEGVESVVAKAKELGDVELLVNNAGLSTSGPFLEQSFEREMTSIRLNIEAMYTLTRKLLPDMVERGNAGIINVASVVGFQAIPYWTTYSATKAFVLSFSEALSHEMRHTGVRVLTVCPGFTKTGLYDKTGVPGLAGKLLPMATPQKVVDSALSAYDGGRVVKVVGLLNWLLTISGAPTPRPILRWLMGILFKPPEQPALPPAS